MSYENPRIKDLNVSIHDVMLSFADGNPGAITVLCQIALNAEKIDPDDAFGPFGPMFALDNLDCYGSRIWRLFKDVCGQDLHKMLGVMRAAQLGFTSNKKINAAIDGDKTALDIPALLAQVKERLPAFQIEPVPVEAVA